MPHRILHAAALLLLSLFLRGMTGSAVAQPASPVLTAVAGAGRVSLDWLNIAGASTYTVYRSVNASGPFLRVAGTEPSSYVDTGLTPGMNFHYVVTATAGSGDESVFSNIVEAQPTGIQLAPQADATVQGGSSANTNFGSDVQLLCKADAANFSFARESYLRFNLSALSGTIGSARLRLKVASTTGSGDLHTAHAVANDAWVESSVTWNNKPVVASALASAVSPAAGDWIEFDVTGQVASELAGDQSFSTALISGGNQLVRYHSKEASNAAERPQLSVVIVSGSVPAAPTGLAAVHDGAGNINLSWDDQSAAGVSLFRIYRSTAQNGPYVQLIDTSNTSFLDNDVILGRPYYYRLVAISTNGNPSETGGSVEAEGLVLETFNYFDARRLAAGTSQGGIGWSGGWEALSGGGLQILNRRIDQTGSAGSTRALAKPFPLDPPNHYHYFSFFARADASGTFSFQFKQTLPGPFVRWAFSRNANGSMTIQGGTTVATSAPGVFAADKEYLVVSKFETNGDIASVKLIDPANPGDFLNEPAVWDLSASSGTGVTIDRLDLAVTAGNVVIDDIAIGSSYMEMIGILASEVPEPLSPAHGASSPYAFPTFSWSEHREQFREMAAPVNYEIEIASDAGFATIVDTDVVGLPRYVHDQPFAVGTYHWRVRSVTDAGRVSAWSATRSFTITPHDETVVVSHNAMATNHWNAVQTAVAQTVSHASQGKSVKLVFPAGDYHFPDTSLGYLLALDGTNRIHIEGTGAHLHFTSRKQVLITSRDSAEVSVSGFTITYAKGALLIQGTVTAVDTATKTVTLAIEPGFPDFTASNNQAEDIFLLLDPTNDGRQKTGSISFYRMIANSSIRNPDGTWLVTLDRAAIPEWQVGDRFVYTFRIGSSVLTTFGGSHSITLYGLDLGGWGNMMINAELGTESMFNVLNVNNFHQEGNWMIGNADGIHCRGHKVGPWIEGTRIQSNGDDGIALYARPASMSSAKPPGMPNAAVFVNTFFNLEPGDEVSFFEPTTGTILIETRVTSVVAQSGGWLVEFEDELPDNMNFTGALVEITQVWNRSKSCGDFMIRNGRMINNRRFAIVHRARRGMIENMEIRGASSRSIHFENETAVPNGLYPSEIIMRNNVVQDSGFVAGSAPPLSFRFVGYNASANSIGPRNLLIDSNTFADCGTPEISMNRTRNAVIRNNRTHNGSGSFSASLSSATASEKIVYSPYDAGLVDVTPPSAPTGLMVDSSKGVIALEWNRGADLDTALFNVYRSTTSGGPYILLAANRLTSEYLDYTTIKDTTYHYVITASDASGNESARSSEVSIVSAVPDSIAFEGFDYADATTLEGGIASGGAGWVGGWQAAAGGGLSTLNGRLGGTGGTSRELAEPFSLNGLDTYFSFIARTDANGTFVFNLKQTSGNFVRWAFARNADGSVTVNGANAFATSAPGLFAADTDYLVVSKFQTAGDIAFFQLFNTTAPGTFSMEPAVWDISAQGLSGVVIDRLDIQVTDGNVMLDNVRLGKTYQSVAVLPPGYAAWAGEYALTGGPADDDDSDSVTNLMEYALGGDPTAPADRGHALVTEMIEDGGTDWFTFTYPRLSAPASGLAYSAIISETLDSETWTSTGVELVGVEQDGYGPGLDAVTVRTLMPGKSRLFIRLRVVLP